MLQARVTELDELNRKLLVRNGLLACELQSVKETNAQDLCTLTVRQQTLHTFGITWTLVLKVKEAPPMATGTVVVDAQLVEWFCRL